MEATWKTVEVAGMPCRVWDPFPQGDDADVVLFLDDGLRREGDEDDVTLLTRHLAEAGLRGVAPFSYGGWWAHRRLPEFPAEQTPEEFVVDTLRSAIMEWWSAAGTIALLGHRMGGQGALRISYRHPDKFPVVAAVAPALDLRRARLAGDQRLQRLYRDAEDARQDSATLHIHPLNWPRHQWFCCDPQDVPWFDSADCLRMKLSSLGVPFESDLETTTGHASISYFRRMVPHAFTFVQTRLEQERKRVV